MYSYPKIVSHIAKHNPLNFSQVVSVIDFLLFRIKLETSIGMVDP